MNNLLLGLLLLGGLAGLPVAWAHPSPQPSARGHLPAYARLPLPAGGWEAAEAGAACAPARPLAGQHAQAAFGQRDLAGQYYYIRQWAARQALPVLTDLETRADSRLTAVRNVGRLVASLDATRPLDVAALTDRNPDYWRACLETSSGNHLLPLTKVMLYAAQGELDCANLYLRILEPVSEPLANPRAVPLQLARELRLYIDQFNKGVRSEIRKGIALREQGRYDQALAHYDRLLAVYPASAWAHYERFLTEEATRPRPDPATDSARWHRAAAVIYRCNPMYPQTARASSPREAYQLERRLRLYELFEQDGRFRADYAEYADIALQLGAYGVAAQLDWLIVSRLPNPPARRDARLADFLYCLDKLGDQQTRLNFNDELAGQFPLIAARLAYAMRQSPGYRAFAN